MHKKSPPNRTQETERTGTQHPKVTINKQYPVQIECLILIWQEGQQI